MARAYRDGDPLLVAVYSKRGALLRGVRRSGTIVARGASGRHSIAGTVKTGLTVAEVAERFRKQIELGKHEPGSTVKIENREHTGPIVSEAKAAARAKAKAKRQARADEQEVSRKLDADACAQALRASGCEHYLAADPLVIAGLVEALTYGCGHALGKCGGCGRLFSWMQGGLVSNRFVCTVCKGEHSLAWDTDHGLEYNGPALDLTLRARPECKTTLSAMRMLG